MTSHLLSQGIHHIFMCMLYLLISDLAISYWNSDLVSVMKDSKQIAEAIFLKKKNGKIVVLLRFYQV